MKLKQYLPLLGLLPLLFSGPSQAQSLKYFGCAFPEEKNLGRTADNILLCARTLEGEVRGATAYREELMETEAGLLMMPVASITVASNSEMSQQDIAFVEYSDLKTEQSASCYVQAGSFIGNCSEQEQEMILTWTKGLATLVESRRASAWINVGMY